MELENEILLATSDGFYYDGVPGQASISVASDDFGAVSEVSDACNSSADNIYNFVQRTVVVAQILFAFCAIICILKGTYNFYKNQKNKHRSVEDLTEDYNEKIEKKPVPVYYFMSVVFGFLYILADIVKKFAAKPIIYIYPEEETEVKIKVKNPEKLTCTYPKYEDEWNVLAKPNGDLIDLKTNRKLYALYWEGINTTKSRLEEGFIVEGENVATFLEEKLEILGLNERESEEFIVYWLPLMEKNKYNYIRFETLEEINENMGLEIVPKPETLIRINMEFKGLSRPFNIIEQKLEKVERKGYTVVEWGGTRI